MLTTFSCTAGIAQAATWGWTLPKNVVAGENVSGIACPSRSLCVAVTYSQHTGASDVVTSTDPASGNWRRTYLGNVDLSGVTCPSTRLCLVLAV